MDFLLSKDEKIANLEKKISRLEKHTENRFERTHENFELFKSLILEMQNENKKLLKDRDYLLNAYSNLLDRLYDSALTDELRDVVEPLRKGLKENFNLVQEVAKEGFVSKKKK